MYVQEKNKLLHVLAYLVHYANENNKLLFCNGAQNFGGYNICIVNNASEQPQNSFLVNQESFQKISNYVNDFYISLKNLKPEEKMDLILDFKSNNSLIAKILLEKTEREISFQDIIQAAFNKPSNQEELIKYITSCSSDNLDLKFCNNEDNNLLIKEIKENILDVKFYTEFENHIFSKNLLKENSDAKDIFSAMMKVAITLNPELTSGLIIKYDFLKGYFKKNEDKEIVQDDDLVDFKRIKFDMKKIHNLLAINGYALQDSIHLFDMIINELRNNETIKKLGLKEISSKDKNLEVRELFLGLIEDSVLSHKKIQSFISQSILEIAASTTTEKIEQSYVSTLLRGLIIEFLLPEKVEKKELKLKL